MSEAKYLRVQTYSVKYDLHHKTVIRWVQRGWLEGFRAGRSWRVLDAPPPDTSKDFSTVVWRVRR